MIQIICKSESYTYNAYHILKAFYPSQEVSCKTDEKASNYVMVHLPDDREISVGFENTVEITDTAGRDESTGKIQEDSEKESQKKERKRQIDLSLYDQLERITGEPLAWGVLTGVRPTKLAMQKLEAGLDQVQIRKFLEEEYCVTKEKAELAYEIACREKEQLGKLNASEGFSLYVGIPFCPSICSYCSFSSSPVGEWKDKIDAYLDALIKELKALGRMAGERKPDTVYVGGGTPTTLEAGQLDRLLGTIRNCFDLSELKEFTVEAGRPDSITREKLEVIRRYPVTRISVNPQTMQQKTLDLVGRKHTVEDVEQIFHLARELGFDNINMDLIAGLPGEDAADMQDTLEKIEKLHPDSLTVHALAIKRAAKFGQEGRTMDPGTEITQMVEAAAASAERMGLVPYYLYRQKNIAGNFENVGYAEQDKAGVYNILIMEERQTIFACGAGSTTKLVLPEKIKTSSGKETNLIRVENVKNITEYIDRIDEMIERKEALFEKD